MCIIVLSFIKKLENKLNCYIFSINMAFIIKHELFIISYTFSIPYGIHIWYFLNFQTTIVAATYDGGVIIGADSRTTTG